MSKDVKLVPSHSSMIYLRFERTKSLEKPEVSVYEKRNVQVQCCVLEARITLLAAFGFEAISGTQH
jgi:hypothetical protein